MAKNPHTRKNPLQIWKALPAAGRQALLRLVGILFFIVIVFTIFSKLVNHNHSTLWEAPERGENREDSSDFANEDTGAENASAEDASAENASAEEDAASAYLSSNGEDMAYLRTVYAEGFYYEPISRMLAETMSGVSYPKEEPAEISLDELCFVHVYHCTFDGETADGELICNRAIAEDLLEIFYELYRSGYQIERMELIEQYGGNDELSMEADNTSCFNYRPVDGQQTLSKHALGLAVDINPFYNPYVRPQTDGGRLVTPAGSETYADRSLDFPYKIDSEDLCCRLFLEHGFIWGGNWNSVKDYQHFEKTLP